MKGLRSSLILMNLGSVRTCAMASPPLSSVKSWGWKQRPLVVEKLAAPRPHAVWHLGFVEGAEENGYLFARIRFQSFLDQRAVHSPLLSRPDRRRRNGCRAQETGPRARPGTGSAWPVRRRVSVSHVDPECRRLRLQDTLRPATPSVARSEPTAKSVPVILAKTRRFQGRSRRLPARAAAIRSAPAFWGRVEPCPAGQGSPRRGHGETPGRRLLGRSRFSRKRRPGLAPLFGDEWMGQKCLPTYWNRRWISPRGAVPACYGRPVRVAVPWPWRWTGRGNCQFWSASVNSSQSFSCFRSW